MPPIWALSDREGAYRELEHPADLLLEITGADLADLFENALFAFYDQVAELHGFSPGRELSITARGVSPADVLRALLSEALYRFDTEGFVAVGAAITVETGASAETPENQAGNARPEPRDLKAVARLWGENATATSHTLATEIKAVTYHRLAVERTLEGTYLATVLLDV